MSEELTICSVYHSEASRRILEMNEEFVRAMNPGASWMRLAVNNSPGGSIRVRDPRIREFPGTPPPPAGEEGYHYGSGLNSLLKRAATRFVLFLDYDFFIARPQWIRDVPAHMERARLGLFGAPYRPRYWVKFRHFPVQYCLFVDREQVGSEFYAWDFRPQYSEEHLARGNASEARKRAYRAKHPGFPSWIRRMVENVKKRKYIATSRDMGYDLYRRYYGKGTVRYGCIGSTATLDDFLTHYYVSKRWHPLLYRLERLIPERWSFVPKQRGGYFTFTRFRDVGCYDVLGTGMEEWWWQGQPFAFHVRGFQERRRRAAGREFDPEERIRAIREVAESFSRTTFPAPASRSGRGTPSAP